MNISEIDFASLIQSLSTSTENGLSFAKVQERLADRNKYTKPPSKFKRNLLLLLRQYSSPLVLLLVVAVLLSAFIGETSDTYIILFILVVTGLLGFWQELNAGNAVEQLQKMIHITNQVLREKKVIQIKSTEVVEGDIIFLSAGDIVPADCRIFESNQIHVNESSLTGESVPVEKKEGIVPESEALSKKTNCLWQGTNVVSGTAKAIVVNTGANTIFGNMAHSLVAQPETAFEKGIKGFGYFLLKITLILAFLIFVFNICFHKPILDSTLFSLALAIGMAPELLPAIMTFTMSMGAKRMLKKKVIVKRLTSIFNFGEVNLLCTDKTGTLTEGNVRVKEIVTIKGDLSDKVALYAYLNASLQNGLNNPIDEAIKGLALTTESFEKEKEIPYDFIRRRLSILVQHKDEHILITKGAVTNILEICNQYEEGGIIYPLTEDEKSTILNRLSEYSLSGLRVIGISYLKTNSSELSKDKEQDMIFMGFVVLEDPIKEGAVESIEKLRKLNTAIKIITGDNRFVATYVAKKIGISNPVVITGDDLRKMTSEALVIKVAQADIFAEIEPQQKEQIIKSLQKSKFVVAYMGDGINDVAAIHAADVGISTNNAVDVAKQAADFVLLEKDLSVLADGIYEGRKSFINSMKYIFINTGSTFGNMLSMSGLSLLLPFFPLLPKQILLINFITDFPYLSVGSDNVDEEELKSPGKWNLKLIQNFMIVFGIHSSIFDFITFFVLYKYFHLSDSAFQTGWFIESTVTQLCILFIIRSKLSFLKSKPGKWLLWTSLLSLLVTIALPFSSLADDLSLNVISIQPFVYIFFILLVYVITADLLKMLFFKMQKSKTYMLS